MLEKVIEKQIDHFIKVKGEVMIDGKIPTYAGYIQAVSRPDREFERWTNPYVRALGTIINLPIGKDKPLYEGIKACRRLFNTCLNLRDCLRALVFEELVVAITRDNRLLFYNGNNANHVYVHVELSKFEGSYSYELGEIVNNPSKREFKSSKPADFDRISDLFYELWFYSEFDKFGYNFPICERIGEQAIIASSCQR